MSTPTTSTTSSTVSASPSSSPAVKDKDVKDSKDSNAGANSDLATSEGRTTIADSVVQKIAGIAAREISGVYSLGSGASRAFGSIKNALPGSSTQPQVTQGVKVEVGETQAAVDLNLVVEYGVAITDLASSIRRNVINAVERMTGLQVTEVNVSVDDVHLPSDDSGEDEGSQEPPRVQ